MGSKGILLLATMAGLAHFSVFASAQNQCSAGGFEIVPTGNVTTAPSSVIVRETFDEGFRDLIYPSGFVWHKGTRTGTLSEGYRDSGALQFRFPAGNNGMSEQRFSFGAAYPEIWIRYWVKVPDNWEHGSGNTNNKFFAIWVDEYEREGPTAVIQTRDSGGNSLISPYVRTRDNRHLGEETGQLFIDSAVDRGRWMQVVIHAKMATSASSKDGVFELYRRWEDEQFFQTMFRYDDWDNYHVGGNRGFAHGYLMGWANATQPAESEWLIDDFTVSDENLLHMEEVHAAPAQPVRAEPVIPTIQPPEL